MLDEKQEEVIRYLLDRYKIKSNANLPEIGINTLIGLINERLERYAEHPND